MIDRSFVERLGHDLEDAAIVQSVIALAKALHLDVVGEGIESPAQAAHLRSLGCDRGQGYLFSRPEPAEVITTLVGRYDLDTRALAA
jgi:EAL domain-containing protein (putative c-di-GMP-specific phosphodiesterase class I)